MCNCPLCQARREAGFYLPEEVPENDTEHTYVPIVVKASFIPLTKEQIDKIKRTMNQAENYQHN